MKTTHYTNRKVTIKRNESDAATICGYAAVFYDEADAGTSYNIIEGELEERIDRSAFANLEATGDVAALFNHDENLVLGRKSNGTLRLGVDDVGLWYEIDVPPTTTGKDVLTLIERGDIIGSSFTGMARRKLSRSSDGKHVYTVSDVDLIDVSPVTSPAYLGTSSIARNVTDGNTEGFKEDVANLNRALDGFERMVHELQEQKLRTLDIL